MAYGIADTGGGVLAPDNDPMGYSDWASMSGMAPGHALVGGQPGSPGYGGGQRQVAVSQQTATLPSARSGAGGLLNFKGNPLSWILLAVVGYWGMSHMSFNSDRRRGR